MRRYSVGTLIEDSGNLGIISAVLPRGCRNFEGYHKINWRDNYELRYANNTVYIIGMDAFHRMVEDGQILIVKASTTPLPS
tara:strand:- start:537 stop:779 length:243 start_codon:yes stop_codon:yes gene_type:complete